MLKWIEYPNFMSFSCFSAFFGCIIQSNSLAGTGTTNCAKLIRGACGIGPQLYGAKITNEDNQPDSTYKTTYFDIENICKKQHIPIAAKKKMNLNSFRHSESSVLREMHGEVHNLSNFQEMQHFYGRKRCNYWTSLWNKLATFELDWSFISWRLRFIHQKPLISEVLVMPMRAPHSTCPRPPPVSARVLHNIINI